MPSADGAARCHARVAWLRPEGLLRSVRAQRSGLRGGSNRKGIEDVESEATSCDATSLWRIFYCPSENQLL